MALPSSSEPLVQHLIREGEALHQSESVGIQGPKVNPAASELVNDLDGTPQAFLFGAFAQRQTRVHLAWNVPLLIQERAGTLDVSELAGLSGDDWVRIMREPTPAHRLPESMAQVYASAVADLNRIYSGSASNIWSGNPSSATVVRRLLAFHGVGPKIASMTANILVRQFHVPLSDYRYIDLSPDTHVRVVMRRLGLVPPGASNDVVVWTARELNPDFPGVFDPVLFNVGVATCHLRKPKCAACPLAEWCLHAQSLN